MSIASKLTTLNALVNDIKHKLRSWNLMPTPSAGSPDPYGLEDCCTILNQISGTKTVSNTLPVDVIGNKKRYAQVSDPNLSPENIVNGVTILGITGTGGGSPSVTIHRFERTYIHPDYAVNSISFDVSDMISNMSQILLCRIRSSSDSMVSPSLHTLWVYETMPNLTVNNYMYTYGTAIQYGYIEYFNSGISVTFNNGILTFTKNGTNNTVGFWGNYILECYYVSNGETLSLSSQNTQDGSIVNAPNHNN